MQLYFSPGACSLSPHIVLREAGIPFDLVKVDLKAKKTEKGDDFLKINPKGQVPTLRLDDGATITEGPVIVQYIADRKPESGLVGKAGTMERVRVQEWLNHITSEIHKNYGWIFNPAASDACKDTARGNLAKRYDAIDKHLAGRSYLTGEGFTGADAYLFTVTNWGKHTGVDVARWPNVAAFQERVAKRPKVQEALKAEGLAK
jgi:glutathione S-transferase